jgi:hypothetical protein
MSREEYLWYSGAMIAVAAVVVALSPPIAVMFLILGLSIAWRGAYLDRKYSKDRPTEKEIDGMSAADFKKRGQDDPRFKKWVNHLYRNSPQRPFNSDEF